MRPHDVTLGTVRHGMTTTRGTAALSFILSRMADDEALDRWWASLSAEQQAEALTIPKKLPAWMADSLRATEILANWQSGEEPPDGFESRPLVEFLEGKRSP